jgi:hypothetical protein
VGVRVPVRRLRENLEPRDFRSESERRTIRQAAPNYGGIPAYDTLSAEERSGWRHHVSNVLGKPYDEGTRGAGKP